MIPPTSLRNFTPVTVGESLWNGFDGTALEGQIEVAVPLVTVKLTPLLATPPTVTTTLPLVAGYGTVVVMLVGLQLVTVAAVPWKVTLALP